MILDYLEIFGSSSGEKEQELGLVEEVLDGEPLYVSPKIDSQEGREWDKLDLENSSVTDFYTDNRDNLVEREEYEGFDAPFAQIVVPGEKEVAACSGEPPVYLRTTFKEDEGLQSTEAVYRFEDLESMNHRLINLKHHNGRSSRGKTGLQRAIKYSGVEKEIRDCYSNTVD